jgi:CMP-N-acetylneuraminic acid synthetase
LESFKSFSTKENNHQDPEDLNILAIIPVRGKTLEFGDSTLLETTIDSAKKSKYISEIIVSTDSNETAEIARMNDIGVPFIRPAVLSEEFIDIFEVVKFTLERVEEDSKHFDLVVLLEEVYPFREENLIDNMILQLIYKGQDTVIAAIQEKRSVWVQADNESELMNIEKDLLMPRSLKKSRAFIGMLGICCVTHPIMIRTQSVLDGKTGLYKITNDFSSITVRKDVDSHHAESMRQLWKSSNK